jgi:ribosomal protein S18 acetylase RimI-like enzyme
LDSEHLLVEPFQPQYAGVFERLNRDWLEGHGLIEAADEPSLRDPVGTILQPGGQIFVALDHGTVVGTCAIVPTHDDPGVWELVKLAVSPSSRGSGLGRRLVEESLSFARGRGGRRVVLLSSSLLNDALRLYERVGFQRAEIPAWNPYRTADIYMVLELNGTNW